jgi:predicted O-linked N-acetylglucosamine transferase (SPINDLY family)
VTPRTGSTGDAMSEWRTEAAESNEKHLTKVIDKMAAAARALGWPEEIVDATRTQMQNIAKMQTQVMDQMMDAWEEQIKAPNPMTGTSAMLSRLNALSSFGPTAGGRSTAASSIDPMNPFKFWAQFAEQWQKASADAMSFWTEARKSGDPGGRRGR